MLLRDVLLKLNIQWYKFRIYFIWILFKAWFWNLQTHLRLKLEKSGIFSTAFPILDVLKNLSNIYIFIVWPWSFKCSNPVSFTGSKHFLKSLKFKKSQIFQYDEHCYLKFSLSTFKGFSEFLKLNCIFDALFLYVSKITYEINLSNILFIVTIKNKPNIQSRQNYIMVNKF